MFRFLKIRPAYGCEDEFYSDNGMESPNNRGKFTAIVFDGKLEGIALIGHTTLVEARSETAIAAICTRRRESNRRFI